GFSWLARRANASGLLIGAAAAQVLTVVALAVLMAWVPEPTGHARQATMFALLAHATIHTALGALMSSYGIWRVQQGFVSARRNTELALAWLWNGYAAAALVPALGLVLMLALAGEGA
ncbi:MAG TPA: cytochrome ubiquinol oxidase subunit I, partial [Devosia sp.]|nr:cytochrome ubiquinol oxidase subunit I [Devosia sp.]